MRFSEWQTKLQAQWMKVQAVPLAEISETMNVNDHSYTITLAKQLTCEIDGTDLPIRLLRTEYTNAKEEFDDLLEAITKTADTVAHATATIMDAMTENQIPGLVMRRLKGEHIEANGVEMVKESAQKVANAICVLIRERTAWAFQDFSIELKSVADRDLTVRLMSGSASFSWGKDIPISYDNIPEDLFFIANAKLIEERVCEFGKALEPLRGIINTYRE
jgi:hypothetical protein